MINRLSEAANTIRDFVAIDFETANSCRCSPCAVGVTIVKDRAITDSFERFILPHRDYREFSDACCALHNITNKTVKNMPEFDVIMQEIFPILDNNIVVAHNMNFDGSVLARTCDLYNIEYPQSITVCTLDIAHSLFGNKNCSLPEVFQRLGGSMSNHHDARYDSEICARIMLAFLSIDEQSIYTHLKYEWPLSSQSSSNPYLSIQKELYIKHKKIEEETNHEKIPHELINILKEKQPLKDKSIVITGDMRISRNSAKEVIIAAGGYLKSGISKKVDILVMGNKQDTSLFVYGGKSTKTLKAEMLIEEGYPIKIISEDDFLKMIAFL